MNSIQALTEDLSLYIHWPFCLSKCPYCDFNSHVINDIDQFVWREGLLTEMKTLAKNTGDRKLKSVFLRQPQSIKKRRTRGSSLEKKLKIDQVSRG